MKTVDRRAVELPHYPPIRERDDRAGIAWDLLLYGCAFLAMPDDEVGILSRDEHAEAAGRRGRK